ncbi:MAG: SAF domain-containing protein [Planctomycetota bacterium]|nr:SAF domain-containing protein [Planctomycetota bacterium]
MLARLKKYVLLVGALAIGLVCAIGLNKEKPEPQADEVVTTQRVYVAAIDMDAGERFDLTKLRIMQVAEDRLVDAEPVMDLRTIEGQFATRRLVVGDPITTQVLQETDQVALETVVPGYSTVTVNSHLDPLLVGLMESGCSVDVSGIIPADENDTLGITRLASNCQVMGVEERTTPDALKASLTLMVRSELVEPILVAMENGDLHLSLTGAANEGDFPSGMIHTLDTIKESMLVEVQLQPEPPEGQTFVKTDPANQTLVSASESEDRTEQLKTLANEVAQQVTEKVTQQVVQTLTDRMDKDEQDELNIAQANAVTHPRMKNYREMEVITPDGVVRYVWRTRDSEPVIIADEDQDTKTSQNQDGEPAKIALQK